MHLFFRIYYYLSFNFTLPYGDFETLIAKKRRKKIRMIHLKQTNDAVFIQIEIASTVVLEPHRVTNWHVQMSSSYNFLPIFLHIFMKQKKIDCFCGHLAICLSFYFTQGCDDTHNCRSLLTTFVLFIHESSLYFFFILSTK